MFFQNMSSEILIFSSPIGYPYRINEWDFRRQLQSSWQKKGTRVGEGHFFDTLNFNSWIKPYIKSFFSFNCTIFIEGLLWQRGEYKIDGIYQNVGGKRR